jgi:hypothetical protein
MLRYTSSYTFGKIFEVSIMPRTTPTPNPASYHKHTKQYYVMRGGKRNYLGSDKHQALKRYHRVGLGLGPVQEEMAPLVDITIEDLANRSLVAQRANWRNPKTTLISYKDWLGRFISTTFRVAFMRFQAGILHRQLAGL